MGSIKSKKMMTQKESFSQLKKFDTEQKILKSLADTQARTILFSIIERGKTTIDLFKEHEIPISSIYKKISELEDLGLIRIEKRIIANRGKKFKVYKSRISGARINIKSSRPMINLFPNSD
ncbi:MAG: ArsR family transcriptional regulator [Nitrosotalea sp.]